MPEVKAQRNIDRDDSGYSLLHRSWGFDAPMVDLDAIEHATGLVRGIWLEYDRGAPVALMETKKAHEGDMHPSAAAAVAQLGDRATIPFFVVRHSTDFTEWQVHPANKTALQWLGEMARWTEVEYVGFLYQLRGRVMPNRIREEIAATPAVDRIKRELSRANE